MDVRERIALHFLRHVVATPEGRAYVLNQVAFAEASDEGRVFARIRAQVDDPALARMIAKHEADEVRHAEMFGARLRATGIDPGPVPQNVRLLDRLDRKLGERGVGFFDRPIVDGRSIMEAYLVLQVIEERALHQFGVLERAFAEVDPETAVVFRAVARDEERHLRYCHAISRRYAPTEALRLATLARFRLAEAEAFRENSAANAGVLLDTVLRSPIARAEFELFFFLSSRSHALPFTRFGRPSFELAAAA